MHPHHFPIFPGPGGAWGFWPHIFGFGLMSLFWLALLGLLIWAVLRLTRRQPTNPRNLAYATPPAALSATEILRQRYARGEIDAITFQQMLERLQATTTPPDEPPPAEPPPTQPLDRPLL